jgi:NAD dependent epimerase/dehydratase
VRALVWYNAFGHHGWLDELPSELTDGLEIVAGDIRDRDTMSSLLAGVDTVYHLAALIGIPYSYTAAESYVQTNVTGTLNLLQAAREHNIRRLVHVSTSEVYGSARTTPMDESHPLNAQSPYAASKIAADQMALAFCRSFDLPVVIVRPFNTYGPRQSARAVIPTIITQLLLGGQELELGDLTPTRDFNFVRDTAAGFIALAECDEAIGQEVNIATGVEHSIGDVARSLIEQINPEARIKTDERRLRPKDSEVFRLLGDNTLITRMTDWSPRLDLDEGLAETIAWFRLPENLSRYKAWLYNL